MMRHPILLAAMLAAAAPFSTWARSTVELVKPPMLGEGSSAQAAITHLLPDTFGSISWGSALTLGACRRGAACWHQLALPALLAPHGHALLPMGRHSAGASPKSSRHDAMQSVFPSCGSSMLTGEGKAATADVEG